LTFPSNAALTEIKWARRVSPYQAAPPPAPTAGVGLERPLVPARKSLDLPEGNPHPLKVACHETLLIYMKQIHSVNRKDFPRLAAHIKF
jgi:hypothetical protein